VASRSPELTRVFTCFDSVRAEHANRRLLRRKLALRRAAQSGDEIAARRLARLERVRIEYDPLQDDALLRRLAAALNESLKAEAHVHGTQMHRARAGRSARPGRRTAARRASRASSRSGGSSDGDLAGPPAKAVVFDRGSAEEPGPESLISAPIGLTGDQGRIDKFQAIAQSCGLSHISECVMKELSRLRGLAR
jgi:hypothetical protein